MTSVFKTPAITGLFVLASALFAGHAFAQADSTTGNRALQGRPVVLLQKQERETPQVTNTTNVTQLVTQSATPDIVPTSSAYISMVLGYIHDEGSGPWMVTGGHRACQSFGYASGYVVEYFGAGAQVACYKY